MPAEVIDHSTLSKLAAAGVVSGAHVVAQSGGWVVRVLYGKVECYLVAERSQDIRLFKRFETLVIYLRKIGIVKFDVDAINYANNTGNGIKRPDRAEALKQAHQAASYDKWFREQVQLSIDDPSPSLANEDVEAEFLARRHRLQELIK